MTEKCKVCNRKPQFILARYNIPLDTKVVEHFCLTCYIDKLRALANYHAGGEMKA